MVVCVCVCYMVIKTDSDDTGTALDDAVSCRGRLVNSCLAVFIAPNSI